MESVKTKQELDLLFQELTPLVPLPGTEHLVALFNQLSARRTYGMGGPQPITFPEMLALDHLLDLDLTPWEAQTLCAMDSAYLDEHYKQIKRSE